VQVPRVGENLSDPANVFSRTAMRAPFFSLEKEGIPQAKVPSQLRGKG